MTITPELLRETFRSEAASITMPRDTRSRVGALARRHRARRVAALGVAAAAASAIGLAVPAALTSSGTARESVRSAAAPTAYESWSPRGRFGTDAALAASAAASWDAAGSTAPHKDVQVLWADALPTGRAAVLAGTDGDGVRRLAVLADAAPTMSLLRDVEAPSDFTHLSFNLFTDDEQHTDASYRDTLVVLTPPSSGWTVEWSGGEDPSYGQGTAATDDGVAMLDISRSGPRGHPTIRLLDGSRVVYEGPIGSQS